LRLFLSVIFINVFREAYMLSPSTLSPKEREAHINRDIESLIIVFSEMAKDLITLGEISYMDLVTLFGATTDRGRLLEWIADHQE